MFDIIGLITYWISYWISFEKKLWNILWMWQTIAAQSRYKSCLTLSLIDRILHLFYRCNQTALVIFDVFKAHRSEVLLETLKKENIKVVYVPASCTDELQPMDQIPNKIFKEKIKNCSSDYYTEQVTKCLREDRPVESIDIKTSTIKPLHARWIMKAFEKVKCDKTMITRAFNNCGIFEK